MEDGHTPTGGNGDRRNRRKTMSGAIRVPEKVIGEDEDEEDDDRTPTQAMKFTWSTPSAPTSPTEKTSHTSTHTRHKRSFSSSVFSRLNFLRNNSEEGRPPSRGERPGSREKEPTSPVKSIFSRKSIDDDARPLTSPTKLEQEGALGAALKQSKTRKRKGSLRKTALLGGRRILSDAGGRERKGSFTLLQRPPPPKQLQQTVVVEQNSPPLPVSPTGTEHQPEEFPTLKPASTSDVLRRTFSYEHPDAISSSESGWSEPAAVTTARLALLTDQQEASPPSVLSAPGNVPAGLSSPVDIKSTTSQTSYASTTDDDDILTFSRPPKTLPLPAGSSTTLPSLPSASASYFASPSQTSLHPSSAHSNHSHHHRKSKRSPLSRTISLSHPLPLPSAEHDYTETEYWGWIILLLTWVTFTVGMGSCLEIWSWAWDVGETPYAPPELENDESLPIVGYYPALMVLTGVVAWVWITVAWVGMKYFRHAKIEV